MECAMQWICACNEGFAFLRFLWFENLIEFGIAFSIVSDHGSIRRLETLLQIRATGLNSGKQPASVVPNDGSTQRCVCLAW